MNCPWHTQKRQPLQAGEPHWRPMPVSWAHLLPGAGLPCPELDVAGNQLIPTCGDTKNHQREEEDQKQADERV